MYLQVATSISSLQRSDAIVPTCVESFNTFDVSNRYITKCLLIILPASSSLLIHCRHTKLKQGAPLSLGAYLPKLSGTLPSTYDHSLVPNPSSFCNPTTTEKTSSVTPFTPCLAARCPLVLRPLVFVMRTTSLSALQSRIRALDSRVRLHCKANIAWSVRISIYLIQRLRHPRWRRCHIVLSRVSLVPSRLAILFLVRRCIIRFTWIPSGTTTVLPILFTQSTSHLMASHLQIRITEGMLTDVATPDQRQQKIKQRERIRKINITTGPATLPIKSARYRNLPCPCLLHLRMYSTTAIRHHTGHLHTPAHALLGRCLLIVGYIPALSLPDACLSMVGCPNTPDPTTWV